jgi:hypothetical protein
MGLVREIGWTGSPALVEGSRKLTFGSDDSIILTVSGRYGKYGESKRRARLRASRRNLAVRRGGAHGPGGKTGKERSLRRRTAHPLLEHEGKRG